MLICCTVPHKSSLHHYTLKLSLYRETSCKVPQFFFIKGVGAINGKVKLLRLVICECSSPELDIIKRRLIIVIFNGYLASHPKSSLQFSQRTPHAPEGALLFAALSHDCIRCCLGHLFLGGLQLHLQCHCRATGLWQRA